MLTYSALFDRALGINPEGIAIDAHDARLTYRELDARAEALAQLLVARGFGGAERIVGVCVPRSAAMIVALLAIVRTGAAYLPLEASQPRSRLHYLVEDSRPQAIVVTNETAGCFPTGQNLVEMGDVSTVPGASVRFRFHCQQLPTSSTPRARQDDPRQRWCLIPDWKRSHVRRPNPGA